MERDLVKKHHLEIDPWRTQVLHLDSPASSLLLCSPLWVGICHISSSLAPAPSYLSLVAPTETWKWQRKGNCCTVREEWWSWCAPGQANIPPEKQSTSTSRCPPSFLRTHSYQFTVQCSMSMSISKGLWLKTLEISQKSSSTLSPKSDYYYSSNCLQLQLWLEDRWSFPYMNAVLSMELFFTHAPFSVKKL